MFGGIWTFQGIMRSSYVFLVLHSGRVAAKKDADPFDY